MLDMHWYMHRFVYTCLSSLLLRLSSSCSSSSEVVGSLLMGWLSVGVNQTRRVVLIAIGAAA